MYTPSAGEGKRRSPDRPPNRPRAVAGTTMGHAGCASVGFVVTVALAVTFYPELVAAVGRLGPELLSTTVLVFVLFWLWTGFWIVAEVAWGWRSRRGRPER